jgi:2',3'-cyclic-nucleotide 2'-phosphodiesterase / 3'-nucleotidase
LKEPDLNKRHAPLFSVALSLALFGGAILARQIYSAPEKQAPASSVSITLLDTTDTHGRIEPWDYYAGKPANIGLAKIATLIKQQRAESPEALLLDCGDTIQGTPLAYYFASKDTSKPNPMIAAFNLLHYDAMAVGRRNKNPNSLGLPQISRKPTRKVFPTSSHTSSRTLKECVSESLDL